MKCMIYASYTADHDDLHHRKYIDEKKELPSDSVYDKSDTDYVKKVGGKYYYNDKVTQYHAFHNYALTLKALWIYADNVNMISIKNGVYNDKALRDEVLSQIDSGQVPESEKKEIISMLNNVHFIFLRYVKDKKITSRNLYNIEMRYLVVGLALHTIGDVYAHRTFIPTYFATNETEFNNAFKNYIDREKYSALKKRIKEKTMIPTEFKNYIKSDYSSGQNMLYEDNPNFMPLRYTYSKSAAAIFVEYYSQTGAGHIYDPEQILIQYSGPLMYSIPYGRFDTIKTAYLNKYIAQL